MSEVQCYGKKKWWSGRQNRTYEKLRCGHQDGIDQKRGPLLKEALKLWLVKNFICYEEEGDMEGIDGFNMNEQ